MMIRVDGEDLRISPLRGKNRALLRLAIWHIMENEPGAHCESGMQILSDMAGIKHLDLEVEAMELVRLTADIKRTFSARQSKAEEAR